MLLLYTLNLHFLCFQALSLMARNADFPARRPTAASPSRTTPCPRTQWPRTPANGDSSFWAPAAACAAKMDSGRPRVFPSAVSTLTSLCVPLSLARGAPLKHHRIPPQKCVQFYDSAGILVDDIAADQAARKQIAQDERKSAHLLSAFCACVDICRLDGTQKN